MANKYLNILVLVFGLFLNNVKLTQGSCEISPQCRAKLFGKTSIYSDETLKSTNTEIFLPEYLLSSITLPHYPLYIIQLKNNLIQYLMKQNYNYAKILEPITQTMSHKSRVHVMIETLITLRDLLATDCTIRSDTNAILVYLLQRQRPHDAREGLGRIPTGDNNNNNEPFIPPTYPTLPNNNIAVLPTTNENIYVGYPIPSKNTKPLSNMEIPEIPEIPQTAMQVPQITEEIETSPCYRLACSKIVQLLERIIQKMDEPKHYQVFINFSKLPHLPVGTPLPISLQSEITSKQSEIQERIVGEIRYLLSPITDLLEKIYVKLHNINHRSLTVRNETPQSNGFENMETRRPQIDNMRDITVFDVRASITPAINILGRIYKELAILVAQFYIPGYPIEELTFDESKYLSELLQHERVTAYSITKSVQPILTYLDMILLTLDNVARLDILYPGKASDYFPTFHEITPVHLPHRGAMYSPRQGLSLSDLQNVLVPVIDRFTKILATLYRIKPGYATDTRFVVLFNQLKALLQRNNNNLEEIRFENVTPLLTPIIQLLQYVLEKLDDLKRTIRSTGPIYNDVVIKPPSSTTLILPTIPTTTTTSTTTTTTTTTTPPPPPMFAYLIPKLPTPETDEQEKYYKIISAFLARKDLELLIGSSINITAYKNEHDLLKALFARSVTLKLSAAELAAVKFYLEYEVKLARLSLVTHKEIHKQFDLSGIILDTINLQALTDEQRTAFEQFFQFILNIQGDQMSTFETWTEAKTKGEFMKLLFDYFLTSTFVPSNVKYAIKVILPTIQMTGAGSQSV